MSVRRCDDTGSVTPLIIGMAFVLLVLVAVVVDASAAFLQRQGLNSTADAAALAATDGMAGDDAYAHGVGPRVQLDPVTARRFVADYLGSSGVAARYPGMRYTVRTTATTVLVQVRAPMKLPLHVAGVGDRTVVSGTAASIVDVRN